MERGDAGDHQADPLAFVVGGREPDDGLDDDRAGDECPDRLRCVPQTLHCGTKEGRTTAMLATVMAVSSSFLSVSVSIAGRFEGETRGTREREGAETRKTSVYEGTYAGMDLHDPKGGRRLGAALLPLRGVALDVHLWVGRLTESLELLIDTRVALWSSARHDDSDTTTTTTTWTRHWTQKRTERDTAVDCEATRRGRAVAAQSTRVCCGPLQGPPSKFVRLDDRRPLSTIGASPTPSLSLSPLPGH